MNQTGTAGFPAVEDDDSVIIQRSLRDPEQFGILFDRHAPHIHRYIARRLGRDRADDLTAETFLTAFRKRHQYQRDRDDARPWLYGIATNFIGRHRRTEVREYRLRHSVVAETAPACHADRVVEAVAAQSTHRQVAAALAELSPGDLDVLLLIAWEDLTYEQTAAALAIPVGTVRSRLNRARTRTRAALGDQFHPHHDEEMLNNG